MTELLKRAVATARSLPVEMQDEIARMVLPRAGEDSIIRLTADEAADLTESDAEVARGEFATDEEMRVIRAKYGQ